MLKSLNITFKGNVLFANIRNQVDPRAVIIYNLKADVTQKDVDALFKKVSENSQKLMPLPKPEGAA